MSRKRRGPKPTHTTDYLLIDGAVKTVNKKAAELIAEGYQPWGAPSYSGTKACQAFVKKEVIEC